MTHFSCVIQNNTALYYLGSVLFSFLLQFELSRCQKASIFLCCRSLKRHGFVQFLSTYSSFLIYKDLFYITFTYCTWYCVLNFSFSFLFWYFYVYVLHSKVSMEIFVSNNTKIYCLQFQDFVLKFLQFFLQYFPVYVLRIKISTDIFVSNTEKKIFMFFVLRFEFFLLCISLCTHLIPRHPWRSVFLIQKDLFSSFLVLYFEIWYFLIYVPRFLWRS